MKPTRKRTELNLTVDNYAYVCELARQHESSLNYEMNRIIREARQSNGKPTGTLDHSKAIN